MMSSGKGVFSIQKESWGWSSDHGNAMAHVSQRLCLKVQMALLDVLNACQNLMESVN